MSAVWFSVLLLAALCIWQVQAVEKWTYSGTDGQPGCRSRFEFTKFFRHNINSNEFWECVRWDQPAQVRTCPPFTFFQDSWQTCVAERVFEWTPRIDPPTSALDNIQACEPVMQDVTEFPPCPECPDCSTCGPCNETPDPETECPPCQEIEETTTEGAGLPPVSDTPIFTCTSERMGTLWPNVDNPFSYYRCDALHTLPSEIPCHQGTRFVFAAQICM